MNKPDGTSTTDQVTLLTEDIETGFQCKEKCGVVLIDLSAALNHLIPERRDVHYSIINANVFPIPVTRIDHYKNSIVSVGFV